MIESITSLLQQYEFALFWVGIGSIVFFIGSLMLLPWMVSLIPVNYFRIHHEIYWHDLLRPRSIMRNLIGLPVLLTGFAMIFLPGQGLLTIMAGLVIMIYPGKFRAERWLVKRQRLESLERVLENYRAADSAREDKLEQKMLDDLPKADGRGFETDGS